MFPANSFYLTWPTSASQVTLFIGLQYTVYISFKNTQRYIKASLTEVPKTKTPNPILILIQVGAKLAILDEDVLRFLCDPLKPQECRPNPALKPLEQISGVFLYRGAVRPHFRSKNSFIHQLAGVLELNRKL